MPATVRASFALYNTHDEVAALLRALAGAQAIFGAAGAGHASGESREGGR